MLSKHSLVITTIMTVPLTYIGTTINCRTSIFYVQCSDVRKTENWVWIRFPTKTACIPHFKLEVTKNNFACIQCAEKGDTQCDCYSLLTMNVSTQPKQSLAYIF